MADWTSDANEALTICLVRTPADEKSLAEEESYSNFHPSFTYPIYGEEEKIYGYKDLVIDLRFASGSLAQYVSVRHSNKLGSSSTVDDVEGTLGNFIPPDYYKEESAFLSRVQEDSTSFKPLGDLIYSYTRPTPGTAGKGKGVVRSEVLDPESLDTVVFEVYHTTWKTPGFKEYHRRMQLFILLYIEAGSYISEEEEQWEFMVLYEKRKRRENPDVATYHFVGYSSLFNFYCFPEKVRMRLSQFVILPPYQRQGHGSGLYGAIYQHVLSRPDIAELTVEDPAEAFEDLRDRNDLKMLFANERFMQEGFGEGVVSHGGGRVKKEKSGKGRGKGKLGPPAEKGWVERWRKELKIAGRQFQRLVEMLIQMHLNPIDARAERAYRLQVKERLYRFTAVFIKVDTQHKIF